MRYPLYNPSTTKVEITLETLDDLIDYMEYASKVVLFKEGQSVELNNFLHNSKDDSGLTAIDGSIRVNDNTLAYYGHDYKLNEKDEAKAFDYVIKQTDTLDVTTVTIYRKGSFMYQRMIMLCMGGQMSNEEIAQLEKEDA